MNKENILVSACLIGENCKYSGGNNKIDDTIINKLREKYNLILVCPEQLGGLMTPREPCEIKNDKVITKSGKDVTANFKDGALETLKTAKENNVRFAILKANSPSCGNNEIYDGNFNGTLVKGKGMTASILIENNIKVLNENEL
ncbi:DUF523 domain-containing protein [Anaerofustis stercorihominis]|uniref:DUF523 domain-containing protein n=1 Tax=Anaerofustis stercorihominis TaxID=214853 RepID=UPI00214CD336|nr:DUF523 domain-containing protein [Anaerofustis stercorihominis]MCR2033277.1 DUF523 domain-containing protein [Anaerofustis stercorihominis]